MWGPKVWHPRKMFFCRTPEMMRIQRLVLCMVMFLSGGCSVTTYHGDALVHNNNFFFDTHDFSDGMELGPKRIDKSGVWLFHVRDLPVGVYPSMLRVTTTEDYTRVRGLQGWRKAKLELTIRK